jgi:hypothetical protein
MHINSHLCACFHFVRHASQLLYQTNTIVVTTSEWRGEEGCEEGKRRRDMASDGEVE